MLIAFEQWQVTTAAAIHDRLMRTGDDKWVSNPLLRALVTGNAGAALRTLLEVADRDGAVHTVGKLSQAEICFQAYLTWLAGELSAKSSNTAGQYQTVPALFERLGKGNAVQIRAAAGLALASTGAQP